MKFDVLITRVYDMDKDNEENREIALATLKKKFENPLRGYNYPPHAYVCFECMSFLFHGLTLGLTPCPAIHKDEGNHQEQVGELIRQTTASIDNLALKMLFVTVQQNNMKICIECAVNEYVVLLFAIASTYSLYFRHVFKNDSIVGHFHVNAAIFILMLR